MKKLLLSLLFATALLSSCKKDDNTEQKSELFYKQKLEKSMNLTSINASEMSSSPGIMNLKFDSYQEMYEAFKFVEDGTVSTKTEPLKKIEAPIQNLTFPSDPQSVTNYYSLGVSDNASTTNSWGTSGVGATYSISTSISFVKQGGSYARNINSSTATSPSLGYSGIGQIEGGMPTASWSSTNSHGTFSVNAYGYATVSGTSISFYITISGRYDISPPATPSGQALITHSLRAEAH